MKQKIRLTEGDLHRIIRKCINEVHSIEAEDYQLKIQEELYKIFCNLESGIKTVIHNTDSTSSQAFGSPAEKLKAIVNGLSHVDKGLQKNAASTFDKLLDVISELCDIRINLKTMGAKDSYWGHNFKTTNGTVGLSNYN